MLQEICTDTLFSAYNCAKLRFSIRSIVTRKASCIFYLLEIVSLISSHCWFSLLTVKSTNITKLRADF